LLCAYLARELKRPVKWWESRSESHQATSHGRAHTELIEVAFRNDGRMPGMKVGEIQEARSRKDGIELGRSFLTLLRTND
jgi:CO/xanthine dehydrogenase Mo-binding subunit